MCCFINLIFVLPCPIAPPGPSTGESGFGNIASEVQLASRCFYPAQCAKAAGRRLHRDSKLPAGAVGPKLSSAAIAQIARTMVDPSREQGVSGQAVPQVATTRQVAGGVQLAQHVSQEWQT